MSLIVIGVTAVVSAIAGGYLEHRANRADARILEAQLVSRAGVLAAAIKAREVRVRTDVANEIEALKALPADIESKVLGIIKRGL